jgi:hypothetical protein
MGPDNRYVASDDGNVKTDTFSIVAALSALLSFPKTSSQIRAMGQRSAHHPT